MVISGASLFVILFQKHVDELMENYFEMECDLSGRSILIAINVVSVAILILIDDSLLFQYLWLLMMDVFGCVVILCHYWLFPFFAAIDRMELYWILLCKAARCFRYDWSAKYRLGV